jgi:hypothetical protein
MSVAIERLYSLRLYGRARLGIVILTLLGLMTFTAVRDMAGQYRTEQGCVARNNGGCIGRNGGGVVALNKKTTSCELTVGGWLRLALSQQAADMLRRLGVPVSYI